MRYLQEVWRIVLELSPYLLLGLIIAGLLDLFIKRAFIEKHLGSNSFSATLKAALIGIPLPLCSCGVIPTGISFKNHGASEGATVSFLISTPQTGIDSILVTYSMMNGPWAIFRPLVALFSGVIGGWLGWANKTKDNTETTKQSPSINETVEARSFSRFYNYAFVSFLSDISRPLMAGILIAGGITVFIPDSIFSEYLTHPNLNMFIILIASVPLYVCATGSVPIGAALLAKGLSPGAVLVFLMAGPATNAATITVLWNALGKKNTVLYIAVISFFALVFGWIMNSFLPLDWFEIAPNLHGTHNHEQMLPSWLQYAATALLLLAIINVEYTKFKHKFMEDATNKKGSYQVEGMTCNHCKANVDKAIRGIEGVHSVEVSLEQGAVVVEGEVTAEAIKEQVEKAGYVFRG